MSSAWKWVAFGFMAFVMVVVVAIDLIPVYVDLRDEGHVWHDSDNASGLIEIEYWTYSYITDRQVYQTKNFSADRVAVVMNHVDFMQRYSVTGTNGSRVYGFGTDRKNYIARLHRQAIIDPFVEEMNGSVKTVVDRRGDHYELLLGGLRRRNVEAVLVVGYATDSCIYPLVRELDKFGFEVFIVGDATLALFPNEDDVGYPTRHALNVAASKGIAITATEQVKQW